MPLIGAIFIIVIVSLFGPILGSFFTATIMRETKQTKAKGARSHCDNCGKQLQWWELIPVFSYIFLRGRCSNCCKRIELKIFLAEVMGLGLFLFFGLHIVDLLSNQELGLEMALEIVIQAIAFGFLLYFAIYDLLTYSIPTVAVNWFVGYSILVNVVFLLVNTLSPDTIQYLQYGSPLHLISGVIAGASVYALILITKEKGIGLGDLYLAIVMGLLLGWPGILAAFYVLIFSATGVGLLFAAYKRKYKGLIIPLVPFMALGYVAAVAFAEEIYKFLFIQI